MYIIVSPSFPSLPSYCYTMLKCFRKQWYSPPLLPLFFSLSLPSFSSNPPSFSLPAPLKSLPLLPPLPPHTSHSSFSSSFHSPHLSPLLSLFLSPFPLSHLILPPLTPHTSHSSSSSSSSHSPHLSPLLSLFPPLSLLPLFKPFGDDHEKQYIYKEPHVTTLAELTLRLQKLYSKKFGPELVHIIQESGKVRVCEG